MRKKSHTLHPPGEEQAGRIVRNLSGVKIPDLLGKLGVPRELAEVNELQVQGAVFCQDAAAT